MVHSLANQIPVHTANLLQENCFFFFYSIKLKREETDNNLTSILKSIKLITENYCMENNWNYISQTKTEWKHFALIKCGFVG